MDTTNSTLEVGERQGFHDAANFSEAESDEVSLTRAERRLLLGASLRLLGHRFSSGKPIRQNDVIRVASLADDAVGLTA